jgi:hypothetical protein
MMEVAVTKEYNRLPCMHFIFTRAKTVHLFVTLKLGRVLMSSLESFQRALVGVSQEDLASEAGRN